MRFGVVVPRLIDLFPRLIDLFVGGAVVGVSLLLSGEIGGIFD
jgi:hypothetical protein